MVSQTISHYRILTKLGETGMSAVYLAEDLKLGRKVAIKFLSTKLTSDERARKRLMREAKAAATLDHPHICTIHEVDEDDDQVFIIMQYVEGETLASRIHRQPLSLRESVAIAAQVADALAEAHSHGIIHRDIKPQNIMITARDQVKVLDFGLAKVIQGDRPVDNEAPTESIVSEPGTIIGTVPYMSPEQLRVEELDGRSDIFSLGVVLYEMVTGRQPFARESLAATASAILTHPPPPLARYTTEVSPELERIMRKCLEKDPQRRYQSARELQIDLSNLLQGIDSGTVVTREDPPSWWSTFRPYIYFALGFVIIALLLYLLKPPDRNIDSVAVLPFVIVNADQNTQDLSAAMTESLTNSLAKLPAFKRVIASYSVFHLKNSVTDLEAVGRNLNVQSVLTGKVVQRGEDIYINVELIDVRDNRHIWGDTYKFNQSEIFNVQEKINQQITENLRLKLSSEDRARLSKRYTENIEAYRLYTIGRNYWNKRQNQEIEISIEYFKRAINEDPGYALAYAGLADAYAVLGSGGKNTSEEMLKARKAAEKALELDNTLAEAHTSLAIIKLKYDWDWPNVEAEFKRALELNQNSAEAHYWYASYLAAIGRPDESIAESRRAQELDPLNPTYVLHVGRTLYFARRYDQVIEQCQKAIEMNSKSSVAHFLLGYAYAQKGMFKEAVAEFEQAMNLSVDNWHMKAALGYTYAMWGKRDEALKILDDLKGRYPNNHNLSFNIAVLCTGLGDKDQAFEWLEKAYEDRYSSLAYLKVEPVFDTLRTDSRFENLLRRIGLVQPASTATLRSSHPTL